MSNSDQNYEQVQDNNNNIDILLPFIHKCNENCQYKYVFGFATGKNPTYKDGKCSENGKIQDRIPRIVECDKNEIWDPQGSFLKPEEIVITDKSINIEVDYPLDNPVTFSIESKNEQGFSRKELVESIAQLYKEIYQDEEKTSINNTIPIEERGTLKNRNKTNGKYKIWGHDIEDLWLEG